MDIDLKGQHTLTPNELEDILGVGLAPTELARFPVELVSNHVIGFALADLLSQTFTSYFEAKWKACLRQCDVILDITWEKLNTGYWKDVDMCWRYVYTTASWLKALSQFAVASAVGSDGDEADKWRSVVRDAVKACDMGLLMGAPVRENVLSKLASRLQAIYSSRPVVDEASDSTEPARKRPRAAECEPVIERPIDVARRPSLERFRTEYMIASRPVVITGAMDFWPAMTERRWSVGYIRAVAGCRTVPVELGSKYTDDDWSQRLMTVDEFVDEYVESPTSTAISRKGYLAQHDLFSQIPELRKDIYVPSYCGLCADVGDDDDVDDVEINAWFGPAGTVSPLHQDPKHNLLCQVVGEKYVRLYGTEYTELLYPHESRLLSNTSRVDVENPDADRFPNFSKAPYTECILKSGEMLYIPPKCWHYVRSLSISFSISFWWK